MLGLKENKTSGYLHLGIDKYKKKLFIYFNNFILLGNCAYKDNFLYKDISFYIYKTNK